MTDNRVTGKSDTQTTYCAAGTMCEIYAIIHEADGVFGVSFPDFPGVASGGTSAGEALLRGLDTLAFHVAGMVADGEFVPKPRTLDELRNDPDVVEALQDGELVPLQANLPHSK